MSTDLTQFNFHGDGVRIVHDEHGQPWFIARDVLAILDLNRSSLASLDDDEKGVQSVYSPGGTQEATTINEPGLYSLILRSRKPEAKTFKRWITHELLPQIRKTGSYAVPQTREERLAAAVIDAQAMLVEKDERIAELAPAAQAWGSYLSSAGDYSVNEAAKLLSRDHSIHTGERRLRAKLEELGWIYRQSGTPRASQAQIDLGRMAEKASFHYHPQSGEKVANPPQVRITPKGIDALRAKLSRQLVAV